MHRAALDKKISLAVLAEAVFYYTLYSRALPFAAMATVTGAEKGEHFRAIADEHHYEASLLLMTSVLTLAKPRWARTSGAGHASSLSA